MSKFEALKNKLAKQGYSSESAGNIAYSVGKKKYGKKVMSKAAHEHKPASEVKKGNK